MTSTRERQRAAARARLEREMAERAAEARKRRQTQAIVGAARDPGARGRRHGLAGDQPRWRRRHSKQQAAGAARPRRSAPAPGAPRTAAPAPRSRTSACPPNQPPNTGTQTMTIDTNLGPITAKVDRPKAPCTARQLHPPGEQELLRQHQVPPAGDRGHQGAAVRRPERDRQGLAADRRHRRPELPLRRGEPADRQAPGYPEGIDRDGQRRQPGSTGSQFFIVYGDSQLRPDVHACWAPITKRHGHRQAGRRRPATTRRSPAGRAAATRRRRSTSRR